MTESDKQEDIQMTLGLLEVFSQLTVADFADWKKIGTLQGRAAMLVILLKYINDEDQE